MGVRFDKWLARPSTLRFLRQIVRQEVAFQTKSPFEHAIKGSHHRRWYTATTVPLNLDADVTERVRPGRPTATDHHAAKQARLRRVANDLCLRSHVQDKHQSQLVRFVDGKETGSVPDYFSVLRHETNVGKKSSIGLLQVDNPENVGNLEAWKCILETRQRWDDWNGVADVWNGLRNRSIDLPVTGLLAHELWRNFVHACIVPGMSHEQLRVLDELYAHAKSIKERFGSSLPGLHNLIVGRFLQVTPGPLNEPGWVVQWHSRLVEDGFTGPHAIRDLAECAMLGDQRRLSFKKFKAIYEASEERDLYDHYMPLALRHEEEGRVVTWHRLFVSMDDLPSAELATDRSIRSLFQWTDKTSVKAGKNTLAALPASEGARLVPDTPAFTRSSMSSLVGEIHGIKPKALSDSFCARMFATEAFSIDFVIRGLAFLGVAALGPLSLRELALRAKNKENFLSHLNEVRAAGLQVRECTYSRLLREISTSSQLELFDALLRSDQHPENYDNRSMQYSLLQQFMRAGDWPQIHLTLITLSYSKGNASPGAWNCLLQHYSKSCNFPQVARIMGHMQAERIEIGTQTLHFLRLYILPERRTGKPPVKGGVVLPTGFHTTDLVINAHMFAANQDKMISPRVWIELLKRCGMAHRMDRLEKVALWLAQHKSISLRFVPDHDRSSESSVSLRAPNIKSPSMPLLSMVFNDHMIQAIVTWGLRSASVRDQLSRLEYSEALDGKSHSLDWNVVTCQPWARGLALLKQLKRFGIPVSSSTVRGALEQRLWILFGPAQSKRLLNVEAVRRNKLDILDYIKHANEVWNERLFEIEHGNFDESPASNEDLMRKIFGRVHITDRKEGIYANVARWTTDRTPRLSTYSRGRYRARQSAWRDSSYVMTDNLTPSQRSHYIRRKTSHKRQAGST